MKYKQMPAAKGYGNDFESSRADSSLYCDDTQEGVFERALRLKNEHASPYKEVGLSPRIARKPVWYRLKRR